MTNQSSQPNTTFYFKTKTSVLRTCGVRTMVFLPCVTLMSSVVLTVLLASTFLPARRLSRQNGSVLRITAQIDPRSETPILLAASGPIGKSQDDGFGVCPAFTHWHPDVEAMDGPDKEWDEPFDYFRKEAMLDGLCHRDDDDSPIKERPKLRKPQFKPNPIWQWL